MRDIGNDQVRFTYKDYRADPSQSPKTLTLAATEFIRRFLLHVLLCQGRGLRTGVPLTSAGS